MYFRKSPARLPCALAFAALVLFSAAAARGDDITPEVKAQVDLHLKDIQNWAADPILVGAVKAQNQNPPAAYQAMTQDKWKMLSVLDPFVRAFTKNEAGRFLKSKQNEYVSEAFLSAADGLKVGFLSKPTNWSHLGKPKHDEPMKGQVWYGPIEVDASTGVQQMQVGVPVLDNGKPIGSLVVGLDITKLKARK